MTLVGQVWSSAEPWCSRHGGGPGYPLRGVAVGVLFFPPCLRPRHSRLSRSSPWPWLRPASAVLASSRPPRPRPAALTKEQAEALAAYDKALREFKAILAQRRAQIDAKQKLPNLPGQARLPRPPQGDEHLQGPHRRAAVAHRAAQQVRRSAGVLRCRHRAADRGVRRALQHHAGAAGGRAGLRDALQGRRRPRHGDRARQGPRCRNRRRGGPHQPRAVLCRDERQPEHRQCALQQIQGQPADGRRGGSQRAQEVGGDQAAGSRRSIRRWPRATTRRRRASARATSGSITGPRCATA